MSLVSIYHCLLMFLAMNLSGCALLIDAPPKLGLNEDGKLQPCSDRPNCISSQEVRDEYYMEPWIASGSSDDIIEKLKRVGKKVGNVTWVEQKANYIRGVFVSILMRYPDDVEFVIDKAQGKIHFRSSSRFGYSDFGINRERILEIKKGLEQLR